MTDQRRLSTATGFSVATTLVPEPHSNLSPAQRIAGRQASQDVGAAANITIFKTHLNAFVQSTNAQTIDTEIVEIWKQALLNRLKGAYNFYFYHDRSFRHIDSVIKSMKTTYTGNSRRNGNGRKHPFVHPLPLVSLGEVRANSREQQILETNGARRINERYSVDAVIKDMYGFGGLRVGFVVFSRDSSMLMTRSACL